MSAILTPLSVILARPRGFCAGVVRAIDIVERALALYGAPVYVRHEIVHNKHVVDRLRARGAVFVEDVAEIPPGALTIFSAHGVSGAVERAAEDRSLDVIDATCPLVRRVHNEGRRYAGEGYDVVLIGHRGHPEVEGTSGQIPGRLHIVSAAADVASLRVDDPQRVAFITQTTLSLNDTRDTIAALKRRFPAIVGQDTRDICYATQNRQNAVIALLDRIELLLVIGSANSSNANRLREIGEAKGVRAHLIDGPAMLSREWLAGVGSLGITAGASTPEVLVQDTVARLATWRRVMLEEFAGREEGVRFRVPDRLAGQQQATV
jgi:4-hydroxy-3-methylbut-2-en-1-yl diphosphate reductase